MFENLKAYCRWLFIELPYFEDVKYQKREIAAVPVRYMFYFLYDLLFGWWIKILRR